VRREINPVAQGRINVLSRRRVGAILRPEKREPDIDKIVAKKLGVKPRKVRAIRSDPRFEPFIGPEPWVPRDWVAQEEKRFYQRTVLRKRGGDRSFWRH
jgi:hypothetical protein